MIAIILILVVLAAGLLRLGWEVRDYALLTAAAISLVMGALLLAHEIPVGEAVSRYWLALPPFLAVVFLLCSSVLGHPTNPTDTEEPR